MFEIAKSLMQVPMNLTKAIPVITQDQVDQAAMRVVAVLVMGVVMNQVDQAAMRVVAVEMRRKDRRTVDRGQ